jgi:subtilisin-like proprotein convertase family protein
VTAYNNLSVHLNGSSDYLTAPDHTNNSPTSHLTVEAWVYPERIYNGGFSDFGTILCKGLGSQNYRLYLGANNSLYAQINGNISFGYSGDINLPINQWTHVAFTYEASTGNYFYYVNGNLAGSGTNNVGNITNGTDSLYIGQNGGANFFQGYIDEVRIAGYVKSQSQIGTFVYRAMDLNDRPSAFDITCYNFDGNLTNNNGSSPRLFFRNGAVFSSRYVAYNKNFPISPMIKADFNAFPAAWYISNNNFRIPATGTQGTSQYDTISIPYCRGVLDINVFLALNHTYEKDLTVFLIAPSGEYIELVKNNEMERGQFITMFNDEADSAIVNNRYTSFLPNIKPFTNISSVMTGVNMRGNWKLLVNDALAGDTGRVYAWGLQFNNMIAKPNLMTLTSTANQNGFWTGGSQPTDTVRMYLRQSFAPYTKTDSAIGYINQFGFCTTYLANAINGNYYIEYKHRNSLAVWSNIPKSFTQGGSTSFSILGGPGNVYGGELISIDGRWCMYSGDINQDGAINGNDFTIFNTQFGQNGYIVSDLNGDNTVNGNDFTIFNTGFGHQTNHP